MWFHKDKKAYCEPAKHFPYFNVSTRYEPHFEKRYRNGEDATLVTDDFKMLMAADGVGGWWAEGIDSGIYSRFLCKSIGQLYNANHADRYMKEILAEANRTNPHKGSSTAVMI
jgi:hypothetical protein